MPAARAKRILFSWREDLGKFQVFSPRQALNIMVLFQLMVNMRYIRAMVWYKYILNTRPTLKNDITSFCEIIPTMTRFIGMVIIKSITKLAKNSLMIKIWWHLEFFMIAKEYIKIKKTSKKSVLFVLLGRILFLEKILTFSAFVYNEQDFVGVSPSGKASDSESDMRRFESYYPSHLDL